MAQKNGRLMIWDDTNFSEMYQIKNEPGKVSYNSEGVQEINTVNIVFNKIDNVGTVIDTVPDVMAVLNSNAVSVETTERVAADVILQENIDTERITRSVAISTVQADVNTEKARIDALVSGTTVDLDTLQELITAYSNADATILATIAALQTQVNSIALQVQTLAAGVAVPAPIVDLTLFNSISSTFKAGYEAANSPEVITVGHVWKATNTLAVVEYGGNYAEMNWRFNNSTDTTDYNNLVVVNLLTFPTVLTEVIG